MRYNRYLFGEVQLLVASNAVESAMRFGAFLIYSRSLSPFDLGLVAVVIAIVHLAIAVSQLGIDTAVISLGSKAYGDSDAAGVSRTCWAGLWLHLACGLPLSLLGCLLAPLLARSYFDDSDLTGALILAFAGMLLLRLAEYNLSVLRTFQRFRYYPVPGILSMLFLVSTLAVLSLSGGITVFRVVTLVLFFAPLVKFVAGLAGLPFAALRPSGSTRAMRDVLGFGKWVWGTSLLETGTRRFNVLLLQAFAGTEATGYFHMASRYAEFMAVIFEPLRKYLLPKFTALERREEIAAFLRKTYVWLVWTLLLVPVAWILAGPVFELTQGAQWLPAVVLFRILVPARLLFLISKPLTFVLFSLKQPQKQAYVFVLATLVYLVAALLLIPPFGALGSSVCLLAFSATILAILFWHVRRALSGARSPVRAAR